MWKETVLNTYTCLTLIYLTGKLNNVIQPPLPLADNCIVDYGKGKDKRIKNKIRKVHHANSLSSYDNTIESDRQISYRKRTNTPADVRSSTPSTLD